jgi:hypothetical protein
MLSSYLVMIGLYAILGGIICYIVYLSLKLFKQEIPTFQILSILFFGLALISIMFGVIEREIAIKSTSSVFYYEMLEQKTFIEEQIDKYDEEIKVLRSGEVSGVPFKNKKEIIILNNSIKRYNNTILRNQQYKDNFWHKERYNEKFNNLNTFEVIL